MQRDSIVVGWREWLALPELGIAAIKAKIDTGARTSSLHVDALQASELDGAIWLRFGVLCSNRPQTAPVECTALATGRRNVIDSGGHASLRWFIRTTIELGGQCFEAEINLHDRRDRRFSMLLGRSALGQRFLIDPAVGYHCARPSRAKAR